MLLHNRRGPDKLYDIFIHKTGDSARRHRTTNQQNQFHNKLGMQISRPHVVGDVPHLSCYFPQLLHTASAYFYLLSSSTYFGPLWSQSSWWPQLWIELNSVNDKMIKYRSIGVPTNKHVPNTIVIAEKISAVRGWNSAFCYNVVFLSSGKCKSFNPSSTSYLFYPI